MTFLELARQRGSIRGYRPDPVEEEKLQQVLEAARLAPTSANRQRFSFVVVRTAGKEEQLRQVYKPDWFIQAPLVIFGCGTDVPAERPDQRDWIDLDLGIAFDHLVLAAHDLGLGTCWIGSLDQAATREMLGLPDDVEPIVVTPLGYPAVPPREKKRKPLSDLVRYEHW